MTLVLTKSRLVARFWLSAKLYYLVHKCSCKTFSELSRVATVEAHRKCSNWTQ